MFKVTKKPKTPNMLWDKADNVPLCKFVNGIFETNDTVLADKLKAVDYKVDGEADAKPIDKMTVNELKAYAEQNGIDLGEAKQKAEILNVIKEAEAKQ
ncbi:MAG: hypothetical protein NC110_07565 [Ruminococcus sp.]|nr:hypothetical protein [Ruminococcus sp.]